MKSSLISVIKHRFQVACRSAFPKLGIILSSRLYYSTMDTQGNEAQGID